MTSNLALKAVSLLLAVLLWFAIAAEKTSEIGQSVTLEFQNIPRDLELTGEPVDAIEVRLRASPGIIQRLGPGDVTARIDLGGATEGERIVHLSAETIRVPFGVRVVKISPAMITLQLERTTVATIRVQPRISGTPAEGYEVGETVADPPQVRVAGPMTRIGKVGTAYTEPLHVEGARTSVTESVNLGLDDPLLRFQDAPRAKVTVHVREVLMHTTLAGLPVTVRGGSGIGVRPAKVEVTVVGPRSVIARLRPEDVRPWIDASGERSGTSAPIAVELAPGLAGVSVEKVNPAEALLRPAKAAR